MDFSKGFKNEFETAVVNEPSVFEPLKFYCTSKENYSGSERRQLLSLKIISIDEGFPNEYQVNNSVYATAICSL